MAAAAACGLTASGEAPSPTPAPVVFGTVLLRCCADVVDISVAKVRRFCERKIPPHVRDQLLWEVATRGLSITIYERRRPWPGAPDPDGPWTRREIAQFRQGEAGGMWTLHWADRNGRWLRMRDVRPAADIDDLIRVVEENRSGAFD